MTLYEKWSIAVQFITLAFLLLGFIYTIKQFAKVAEQLKQNALIHAQNHKWNRMIASQEALLDYSTLHETQELIKAFDILNRKEPIPLKEILSNFKERPELQNYSHKLLNLYEGFARGIRYAIYEEGIIKNARKGVMKTLYNSYRTYIEHRREATHIKAWIEFESLVNKWHHEDSQTTYEQKTGEV